MALRIAWRVNPVEGSVVPSFLTGNLIGVTGLWVLLVSCTPAWIVAVSVSMLLPVSDRAQYGLACAAMLVLQAVSYFLIGKLISVCVWKLKNKNEASNRLAGD